MGDPFIYKGLKNCCLKKRSLYFKYQHQSTNKTYNKQKYTKYTKILKRCIQKSHQLNNNKYIVQSKNKCKASWNIIKNNINMNTHKIDIKAIKKNDII